MEEELKNDNSFFLIKFIDSPTTKGVTWCRASLSMDSAHRSKTTCKTVLENEKATTPVRHKRKRIDGIGWHDMVQNGTLFASGLFAQNMFFFSNSVSSNEYNPY